MEVLLSKLYQFVTHFIVTCNDEASFSSAKCVTYIGVCATVFAFYLKVSGDNIIMCTLKSQNYVAANTVPGTVVPHTFSQVPVFLARMMR